MYHNTSEEGCTREIKELILDSLNLWKDLECKIEELHSSASLEVKDLMERVSKANEKNRRLQNLCEQQSQQLNKSTTERKQQLEEKKSIKSKFKEAQEFAVKLAVSQNS